VPFQAEEEGRSRFLGAGRTAKMSSLRGRGEGGHPAFPERKSDTGEEGWPGVGMQDWG